MIIRTNRITFASDKPNSNQNEFKNNTNNDFPKLDNFLNAQLYSVSKEFGCKEKCLSQNYNIFKVLNGRAAETHFKLSSKGLNK
jgi:hypothetical protein